MIGPQQIINIRTTATSILITCKRQKPGGLAKSRPRFENQASDVSEKAVFCLLELALGQLVLKHMGSALLKSIILSTE